MIDLSKQKLLIVAPHPDDEVIGCGGLIKKIKSAGGTVFVQFLTVADTKDFSDEGTSSADERLREIEAVAQYLKFDDYELAFSGDNFHLRLDKHGQRVVMDLVERESRLAIEKIKPTMIAFPAFNSYNQDHQISARAVHAALRPSHHSKHFVPTVLEYEMPAERWRLASHTEVNYFVRLDKSEIAAKLESIKLYTSQLRPKPNPREPGVIEAFAKLRGAQCGASYAEAFIAYRMVV